MSFRRTIILSTLLVWGLSASPAPVLAASKSSAEIPRNHISLHNLKTGKKIRRMRVVWQDPNRRNNQLICGKYGKRMQAKYGWKTRTPPGCPDARGRIAKMLRDRKTGKQPDSRHIDKLIWYLYLVGNKFQKPIHIVSGRRANARLTSRHNKGLAVDFRIPGVDPKVVWEYCKSKKGLVRRGVGLGYYPTSKFVHIDARTCPDRRAGGKRCTPGKSYFWIDDSGPGQASRYRKNVRQPTWQWKTLKARKAAVKDRKKASSKKASRKKASSKKASSKKASSKKASSKKAVRESEPRKTETPKPAKASEGSRRGVDWQAAWADRGRRR